MKKLHLLCLGLLSLSSTYAQEISDALRYSQGNIQGTARFRALSGAFGALGGDLSAININPASSAVFNQSYLGFSLGNSETNTNTNYFGNDVSINDSNFNLAQGGAVFVFKSTSNSPWKKFSFGVSYDRTNDFDDAWNANGLNTNSTDFNNTIGSYFSDIAQGFQTDQIAALPNETLNEAYAAIGNQSGFFQQQAFLGFESFILEPETDADNNTSFLLNIAQGDFDHNFTSISNGYSGKVAFNFATQYEDKLYLGLNLNSHFIDYESTTVLVETNVNGNLDPDDPNSRLIDVIDFENRISTVGRGFSFQLGGIYKVTPQLRLGLTYDSPTWYTIEEETSQFLQTESSVTNLDDPNNPFLDRIVIDPSTINVFPSYRLQTPGKIAASAAYVFGKKGLLSFDYSTKDYGAIELRPDVDFSDLNTAISNVLTRAATYRLGGEYKHEQFSFRGGFRYEESPYENGITVGDLTGFSLGLGYNFGNTKLDLTFDQWQRTDETPLFNIGLLDTASIDRRNSNITLSLGFNI
jgi:hypothetical protein